MEDTFTFLRSGGFSDVYNANYNGREMIMKVVKKNKIFQTKDNFPYEAVYLKECQDIDGVVNFFGLISVKDHFIFAMEPSKNAIDLYDYITEKFKTKKILEPQEEIKMLRIFEKVLTTNLELKNKKNLYHLDIKDENIVMYNYTSDNPIVKLIDFGNARKYNDNFPCIGTCVYMPPEYFNGTPRRTFWLDEYAVWSLGILLFDMLTGNIPFETEEQICSSNIFWIYYKPDPKQKKIITDCLQKDPEARITFDELGKTFESFKYERIMELSKHGQNSNVS